MVSSADQSDLLRSSLRERIKDLMLQRIVSGEYAPGERLVETRIAQELGVSQASVREALRDLEHIGCVGYEPYRGCSVRKSRPAELLEAFPVRAALESWPLSSPRSGWTTPELGELERLYEQMLAAARPATARPVARGCRVPRRDRARLAQRDARAPVDDWSPTRARSSRSRAPARTLSSWRKSTCRSSTRSRRATASAPRRRCTAT